MRMRGKRLSFVCTHAVCAHMGGTIERSQSGANAVNARLPALFELEFSIRARVQPRRNCGSSHKEPYDVITIEDRLSRVATIRSSSATTQNVTTRGYGF